MPFLSGLFIKTAFVYLLLGLGLGTAVLASKASALPYDLFNLLPLHVEWLFFGWTVQFALGVAYWILPRMEDNTRGRGYAAWSSYLLLNGAMISISLSRFSEEYELGFFSTWLRPVAGLMLFISLIFFAIHIWPRVRPFLQRS